LEKNMDPYFVDNSDDYGEDNGDNEEDDEDYYDHDNFEYDDMYDDVADDYGYDAWHLDCSCMPIRDVLSGFVPRFVNTENISHKDVFFVSHYFTKLIEVIDDEDKDQMNEMETIGLGILTGLAETAGKLKQKMKVGLHLQLKNVLGFADDIVVSKILELLLDDAKSSNDWDLVNFEENLDQEYKGFLLNAHDYFVRIVQQIEGEIESNCCGATHDIFAIVIDVVAMVIQTEDEMDDWQTYLGIKSDEDEVETAGGEEDISELLKRLENLEMLKTDD